MRAKYCYLLNDPDVKRWFDNLARGSIVTAESRLRILGIQNMEEKALHAPNEVQKLLEERDEARKRKDWQTADIIRKKITENGFSVIDTPNGQKLERK